MALRLLVRVGDVSFGQDGQLHAGLTLMLDDGRTLSTTAAVSPGLKPSMLAVNEALTRRAMAVASSAWSVALGHEQVGLFGAFAPDIVGLACERFEDFESGPTSSVGPWWFTSVTGTGAGVAELAAPAGRIGVLQLTTGTTATGRASLRLANTSQQFRAGSGELVYEAALRPTTLSDSVQRYSLRPGFGDATGDHTDGIYFEYDDSLSLNWRLCAANNSVRTKTNSSIAVVAGAWVKLTIVVNETGTSAEFFVNGVSAGIVTTNIPIAAGREFGAWLTLLKSVGTTARTCDVDYIYTRQQLTTPR